MPYSDVVISLTSKSEPFREAALGGLLSMFKHLPKAQQLLVAEEPGERVGRRTEGGRGGGGEGK